MSNYDKTRVTDDLEGGVGGCGQEDGGNEVSSCPAEELASRKKTRGNEVSSCPAEALACRKKTRGAQGAVLSHSEQLCCSESRK